MLNQVVTQQASVNVVCFAEPPPLGENEFQAIEQELVSLATHINCTTYRMLGLIRTLEIHGAAKEMGFCSTAYYLNWRIGLDLVTAREKVRVALALPALPLTSEALKCGKVSYAKVRAISRIATPENEEALLNIAMNGTTSHVEKVVRRFRRATASEPSSEKRRHEGRYLHIRQDENGMWVVEARLPPEEGALLAKTLDAAQESIWKQTDASQESSATPAQKRVDALGLVARAALDRGLVSQSDENDSPSVSPSPFEVVVHVDAEVLKDQNAEGRCECEDGGSICAESCRRIACDSALVVMTHGKNGEILDIGRKTRVIPTGMRRALANRDKGCCFPGCEASSRFLEAHHVRHWADGGETKLENLAQLCSRHHHLIHAGGFTVQRREDGSLEFIAPTGTHIPAVGALVPADDEAFSARWRVIQHDAALFEKLNVWNGDSLDYDWVVEELIGLENQKSCVCNQPRSQIGVKHTETRTRI